MSDKNYSCDTKNYADNVYSTQFFMEYSHSQQDQDEGDGNGGDDIGQAYIPAGPVRQEKSNLDAEDGRAQGIAGPVQLGEGGRQLADAAEKG